jgi:AmmeMemoRadiSam system protein B
MGPQGSRPVRYPLSRRMSKASSYRPRLRAVECITLSDPQQGRVLVLRDPEGIASRPVDVPGYLAAVLMEFDGTRSVEQIALLATRRAGQPVTSSDVERFVSELDGAWLLDSPQFRARRSAAAKAFAGARVRPARHAGGAYHGDPLKLRQYIETQCLAAAPPRPAPGRMLALCAPHMDLWRAATGYGHAYRALAGGLVDAIDTFILLGTSHAPMRAPFAVCGKIFETPLGRLEPDREAVAKLAAESRFDVHEDEYLHKTEHSLEFQAVFLRHLLGARPARILPILCGLNRAQGLRQEPLHDREVGSFLSALSAILSERGERAMVIAGADLAHVGPRFGDPAPLDDKGRETLRTRDAASIRLAIEGDAGGFFAQVAEDLDTRRVCGLGPLYTLLRVLPRRAQGEVLHYAQCVDPDEGSIVSHTSLSFYAAQR